MSDYDSDALAGFDEFFGDILARLIPAKRRAASRKLGQALRRANLARIAQNVQPDGTPMEPRKPRLDRRGRVRKAKGGKMFRRLRYARQWRIDAQANSVEITQVRGDAVSKVHHFGLRGYVGKTPDGQKIFAPFPRRRLLGFATEDEKLALDIAAGLIGR